MRLSEIHPIFYHTRILQKRLGRHISNLFNRKKFAREFHEKELPYIVKKHQSLLKRRLGVSEPELQENKIVNLSIAVKKIDGILIRPGQTLSYWNLVGKATRKKGYIEGMLLSRGEVIKGVGGGLCQLANLLYWMALHTPLQVVERHHHSFDPFPDDRRTLPFGSGASVFYNYVDLRFYNPTNTTFQIKVWLTDKHLKGAIYADQEIAYSYHIIEKKHRFLAEEKKNYRENEIWRLINDKRTGNKVREEFLIKNFSEVKYAIPAKELEEV